MNPDSSGAQALGDWWRDLTETEIGRTVPKAEEYGSGDLAEIGHAMARIMGRDLGNDPAVAHQEATEIGVFFYLVGKVARWEQAIRDGRRASDDTLFDIGVYSRMAQRNRAVGGWPHGPDPDNHAHRMVQVTGTWPGIGGTLQGGGGAATSNHQGAGNAHRPE